MGKKKIIAIVLAVALIAGGLVSLTYAQEESVNSIHVAFDTIRTYAVPGDDFLNHEVIGGKNWGVAITNEHNESEAPVTGLTVTLNSDLEFDVVENEEILTQPDPSTYEWFFGELPDGGFTGTGVWVLTPDPSFTFTPGFDASRSMDKTEFLQSEGTQTQTVTITVTPRQPDVTGLVIAVAADYNPLAPDEYDLVDAVIPAAGDWQPLIIPANDLELDEAWTTTVEIEVTPKVPQVEFMPWVYIFFLESTASGTIEDSSASCPMHDPANLVEEVGIWTVSGEGSYVWHWDELLGRAVKLQPCCRRIIEPMTGQKLVGWGGGAEWSWPDQTDVYQLKTGFFVENPDAVSEIDIDWVRIFASDGEVIYEGKLLVTVDDELVEYEGPLKPHEKLVTGLENYELPPPKSEAEISCAYTVEIFWSWTDNKGLPLTGWASSMIVVRDDGGETIDILPWSTTQMVNMEQVLTPDKPKKER